MGLGVSPIMDEYSSGSYCIINIPYDNFRNSELPKETLISCEAQNVSYFDKYITEGQLY